MKKLLVTGGEPAPRYTLSCQQPEPLLLLATYIWPYCVRACPDAKSTCTMEPFLKSGTREFSTWVPLVRFILQTKAQAIETLQHGRSKELIGATHHFQQYIRHKYFV